MSPEWLAGAGIIAVASFVFGLTGFGIGLVALSLLPFLMPPATAVPLVTAYATVFTLAMLIQLRRDVALPRVADLLIGTVVGTPIGVWVLATFPAGILKRLIGLVLIGSVVAELRGLYPQALAGRGWGLGAGLLSGLLGGAVGMPGPPVILYVAAQGWSPRTMKAALQAFFFLNQSVILGGYWWAGLLTREVAWFAVSFAVPAVAGVAAGMNLFDRVDHARFRRIVFALLFVLGLVLLVRG